MSYGARSHKVRKIFLDIIEKGYSPSKAAKTAGESLTFFKKWKAEDLNFSADWEDALEGGADRLEDVATKRAIRGSDYLLDRQLKARRPEKYREKSGNDVKVDVRNDFGDIDAQLQRKIDKALGRPADV